MSLPLGERQAIEQPTQFPLGDLLRQGVLFRRPLEATPLQTAIQKPESIVIPLQDIELVPLTIAEDEEAGRERV